MRYTRSPDGKRTPEASGCLSHISLVKQMKNLRIKANLLRAVASRPGGQKRSVGPSALFAKASLLLLLWGKALSVQAQYGMHVPRGDVLLLVEELERQVQSGNRQALRDLATLLDHPEQGRRICDILREYTLFLPREIDPDELCDKKAFLNFFYDHRQALRFSPLLMAFYLTPLEERQPEARLEVLPDTLFTEAQAWLLGHGRLIRQALSTGNQELFQQQVHAIMEADLPEGYRLLARLLNERAIEKSALPSKRHALGLVADAISQWPHEQALHTLLRLAERDALPSYLLLPALEQLTNISLAHLPDLTLTARHYRIMFDTLGSLAAMREAGYRQLFDFRKAHFQYEVDYYGRILSLASRFPYIQHNAIQDLVRTHHPRALFYIAAQLFQYRQQLNGLAEGVKWVELLEKLTHIRLYVQGSDGSWHHRHTWSRDRQALVRYVSWWAAHYDEFEWDEIRAHFIHKKVALAQKENYEQYLRRLHSSNDSVALHAWMQLAEGDPVAVTALLNKYRGLFRRVNPAVPPLDEGFLEQWVQLTDFCRKAHLPYKPSPQLKTALIQLQHIDHPRARFHFENQLLQQLTLAQATALEYWCSLHPRDKELNLSIGRILDRLYAREWYSLSTDFALLRLYLKKAMAFKRIKALGLCQNYLARCRRYLPVLEPVLREMRSTEYDADVKRAIALLLDEADSQPAGNPLERFLERPDAFSEKEIGQLPEPDGTAIQECIRLLYTSYEEAVIRNLFTYMRTHPRLEWTPLALKALQRGAFQEEALEVLEALFHYTMPDGAEGWLAWWRQHGDTFHSWGPLLYRQLRQHIREAPQIDIHTLAQMVHSPWYDPADKEIWLAALPRMPRLQLQRLRPRPPLDIDTDLKWFESLAWTHRTLDDLPALFDMTGPVDRLVSFLTATSRSFALDHRASFFNRLFRQTWFLDYVIADRLDRPQADTIRRVLETWLDHSPFISEFEETTTLRNIALLSMLGYPLTEKVRQSTKLPLPPHVLVKLQETLLAKVQYAELPALVPLFDSLAALTTYNFLHRDFGLPIFHPQDPMIQQVLLERLRTLPPRDLYLAYLSDFGVDLYDEQGQLDYHKIYDILEFEIVLPFASTGGLFRDYFTYGVIKVLEYHFRTRLGFHEKLNENQSFYVHTPVSRARAWQQFLLDRGLVQLKPFSSEMAKE